MAGISITDLVDVEVPTDDKAPEIDPSILFCEQCGNGFEHKGRGRKPKICPGCKAKTRPTSTRRNTKDVDTAMAVLDSTYGAVALGLMMLSPRAAATWGQSLEQLQVSNRAILSGDPNLCKSICRAGEKSGKAMFAISHVIAIAPVVGVLREDLAATRKPRVKKSREQRAHETTQERLAESREVGTDDIPNANFF